MKRVGVGALTVAALAVLCAPAAVATESAATTRVEIPEAGVSIAYPTSWTVITDKLVKDNDDFYATHPNISHAANDRPRFGAMTQRGTYAHGISVRVETSDPTIVAPPGTPELSLEEWKADQRYLAKQLGYEFLDATKARVGDHVGWRSDTRQRWKVKGKSYSSHRAELTLYFDETSAIGRRNVFVRVLATGDDTGQEAVDRILGSIRPL
jgi:hypothetical protein